MWKTLIRSALGVLALALAFHGSSAQALSYQQDRVLFLQGLDIKSGAAFSIAGTQVTSDATELSYLDITTLGSSQNSKALTLSATGKLTLAALDTISVASTGNITWASGGILDHQSGGTLKLHGLTIDATEAGALDGITLGQSLNSKVLTVDAWGRAYIATGDSLDIATGASFLIAGAKVTSSAAEINYVDVTTVGLSENSKAATYSATGKHDVFGADSIVWLGGSYLGLSATAAFSAAGRLSWGADSVVTLGATGKLTTIPGALTVTQTLTLGSTALTATGDEINYTDITTLGTSQDSKVATYSATGKHTVATADTITVAGNLSVTGEPIKYTFARLFSTNSKRSDDGLDSIAVTGVAATDAIIAVSVDTLCAVRAWGAAGYIYLQFPWTISAHDISVAVFRP